MLNLGLEQFPLNQEINFTDWRDENEGSVVSKSIGIKLSSLRYEVAAFLKDFYTVFRKLQ